MPDFNIDDIEDSEFDTDAIRADIRNGNFSPDDIEDYRHENIVRSSLINGLFTQARDQCRRYRLDYNVERFKFDGKEPY